MKWYAEQIDALRAENERLRSKVNNLIDRLEETKQKCLCCKGWHKIAWCVGCNYEPIEKEEQP